MLQSKYEKENSNNGKNENNDLFNEFIFHSALSKNTFPKKINTDIQSNHKTSQKIVSNDKKKSLNENSSLYEVSSDYLKCKNI